MIDGNQPIGVEDDIFVWLLDSIMPNGGQLKKLKITSSNEGLKLKMAHSTST